MAARKGGGKLTMKRALELQRAYAGGDSEDGHDGKKKSKKEARPFDIAPFTQPREIDEEELRREVGIDAFEPWALSNLNKQTLEFQRDLYKDQVAYWTRATLATDATPQDHENLQDNQRRLDAILAAMERQAK